MLPPWFRKNGNPAYHPDPALANRKMRLPFLDRTLRAVGIALIVAAIVILFASVLWFIASLARGPSRGARPAGPVAPAAEIAGKSPDPPPLAAPQLTKEGS